MQGHSCTEESSAPSASSTPSERFCSTITISSERKRSFFDALAGCSTKPAVLAVKQEYHKPFITASMQPKLPSPLMNLYDAKLLSASYVELLAAAETVRIDVSKEKCLAVEENTREQYKSRVWYRMRSGRVSASTLKAVCCTNIATPALSVISSVCHLELKCFQTSATAWGCKHEEEGRQAYIHQYSLAHENHNVKDCGLFIHLELPFLAATPDGVVSCTCCDEGVLEVL